MDRYRTKGRLFYYPSWWLVVYAYDEIIDYYRKLEPALKLQPPRHGAHITVVSGKYEEPPNKEAWNKYHLESIEFEYEAGAKDNGEYFWLTVHCERFEEIRKELGLNPTIPVPWHLTIGNLKNV